MGIIEQYTSIHYGGPSGGNRKTIFADGKEMTQEEYDKHVEEKSKELAENIDAGILILSCLLLPILLFVLGGR